MDFPHHRIDLERMHDRLFKELGLEPLTLTQQQDLIDIVLTSIPDKNQRPEISINDDRTGELIGRYIAIPLFIQS